MFIKAMNEIIADIIVKLKHISSGPLYIDVPTITSEHSSSESNFEVKLKDKIYPYNQSFEKQEEELIELKLKHHDELRKFSSGPIQN